MNSSTSYKVSFFLFAGLPIIFFLLFGFDGMDVADRGFIPAFAYRILSGQAIYQDFFYVRPPLSPYLHTFEMALLPDSLEMIGYRFFFYVFLWLSILFSILALKRFFDFEKMGVSPWLIGAIAYVLSVHNFFAAPWHTLDGILFASLGIFLISRGPKLGYLVAGLFAMGLSAMAKQPFAVVPIVGLGLVVFLYPIKRAALAMALTACLAGFCYAAIEFWLTPGYDFARKMLDQTTGVTSITEMQWSAFKLYVRPAVPAVMACLLWWVIKSRLKSHVAGKIMGGIAFAGFLIMAIGPLIVTLQAGQFVMPKSGFYHGLLVCGGLIAGISFWNRGRRGLAVLLAMLVVAWASGVSWGYASPVLYSLPSVFAIAYFIGTIAEFKAPKWFWPMAFSACLASVATLNLYVYHDDFRTQITHDLGEVSPKLGHIQAGKEQFDRYEELSLLRGKYGDFFTVLPSMPAAHYVTHTQPRIAADWVHDAEINYQKGIPVVIQQLESAPNYVFALKDEMHRANESGTFRCSVLRHVIDHWVRVDSTDEFWVYAQVATGINAPSL